MSCGSALIIDDEPDVVAFQGRILSDHGWRVRIASNGDQGLALALDEAPDVVLLDLMMPGGRGGLSTFMEFRRNPRLTSIPVVFVTAYPEPDPDHFCNFLGRQNRLRPDAYIEKPVEPEKLLATLEKLTGARDQRPEDRP